MALDELQTTEQPLAPSDVVPSSDDIDALAAAIPTSTGDATPDAAPLDATPTPDGLDAPEPAAESVVETPAELAIAPVGSTDLQAPNNLVIVVHASVGSGHRSAANAIAQAFELLRKESDSIVPADIEVEVIDILDYGRIKFDGDATASMFVGATRPIYDLTWRYTFTGRLLWAGGTIWSRIMFAPFTALIAEKRPLAIVATHIVGANAAVSARMITGQTFPVISVPTDYETEGLWPHRYTDLFCVATESMAETLRARKIEDERIRITGIPTREAFRTPCDRDEVRERFGLPKDKPVVLALAGAYLPRPYLRLRETIDKTLPYLHTLQSLHFVLVAGNDEEYERRLRRTCEDLGVDNVTVFGYVSDMASLMMASDVVMCKSGGLTVTECLCAEAPMVLIGKAYGQEKINVEMLTAAGAAMHVTTARELVNALRYLMDNPGVIDAMLTRARILRKPNAARDIAEAAIELARMDVPANSRRRKKHFFHVYWGHRPAHVR